MTVKISTATSAFSNTTPTATSATSAFSKISAYLSPDWGNFYNIIYTSRSKTYSHTHFNNLYKG